MESEDKQMIGGCAGCLVAGIVMLLFLKLAVILIKWIIF
jgi:hypothetical protein